MGGSSAERTVSGPIEEQPSLWQQSDLLSLVSDPVSAPAEPAASASVPVSGPASAPAKPQLSRSPSPKADRSPQLPTLANRSDATREAPATLLILDTETTGLEPTSAQCIEVGAVLFHVPQRAVLSQVSFLLPAPANPAEPVNGIPAEVSRLPQPWQAGLQHFEALLAAADAVLAHNAAFDAQWFGRGPLPPISKPWICSMDDIHWPPERQLRAAPSVRDLALAYGVPVWAAHRALTDCTYLVQVLERCSNLEELLLAALEPRLLFRATLSYAERHRAKEAGFRWNDPVRGAWTRRLSEREAQALPFPVQRVDADPMAA
jgi:DNA polymerase-3 subunit epsilon